MTELITIRKSLAEALLQGPLANHQTVTALTALRRQVRRQEGLKRTSSEIEPIVVIGQLKWACSEGTAYYVKCNNDIPEHIIDVEKDVMTVAQHYRILDAVTNQHNAANQEEHRKAARTRIVLHIADQLLSDPSYEMEGIDFDYETSMHDKIKALIAERNSMKDALTKIAAIEDRYNCGDWDEIEEARDIANAALGNVVSS